MSRVIDAPIYRYKITLVVQFGLNVTSYQATSEEFYFIGYRLPQVGETLKVDLDDDDRDEREDDGRYEFVVTDILFLGEGDSNIAIRVRCNKVHNYNDHAKFMGRLKKCDVKRELDSPLLLRS